jgi:hypothetical protein
MNRIIKGLGIALGCVLIASSCSEISFGDKFLGDQPESSGSTTEEMFSSKINAEKVLTKAYTGLPYGLPTGSDYKLGVNQSQTYVTVSVTISVMGLSSSITTEHSVPTTSQRILLTVMEASLTGPPSVTLGYISRT